MGIALEDSFAAQAAEFLEGVVSVDFVAGWKHLEGVLDRLLELFARLVTEEFVEQGPRDIWRPVEFLLKLGHLI
jgi:hypothetical protein